MAKLQKLLFTFQWPGRVHPRGNCLEYLYEKDGECVNGVLCLEKVTSLESARCRIAQELKTSTDDQQLKIASFKIV